LECTAAYSTAIRCYQYHRCWTLHTVHTSPSATPRPGIGSISPAQEPGVATAPEVSAATRDLAATGAWWLKHQRCHVWRIHDGDISGICWRTLILRIYDEDFLSGMNESMHLVLHTSSHRQPPQKRHRQPSTLSVSVSLWNMPSNLGRLGFGKTVKRYPLSSSLLGCSVSSVCSVRLCQYLQVGFVCSFCPCRNDGHKLGWCSLLWRFYWFWIVF